MKIEKYSMGIGDRFAHQGKAQLAAMIAAREIGIEVTPVWNKSNREHTTIGTAPASVRAEADAATNALCWNEGYHVDADHIGLGNVDLFIESSDFFTLDVADFTGEKADQADIDAFVEAHSDLAGKLDIPGVSEPMEVSVDDIRVIAEKYLLAVKEAGKIYRHVESVKGEGNFITEVSMDETDLPQTPVELVFILAAIADEKIPAQTIAPKFTGRFNKGVDYVGDVAKFEQEFNDDIAVIAWAIKQFGMQENLKLSVHSGSDKFSIYPAINKAIKKYNTGLHLKTAGTTWLEEIIGLAEAGGEGLDIAKEIYAESLAHYEELCAPYATVIDIDASKLPSAEEVASWSSEQFVKALRHDLACDEYNLNLRQLLHVGYKIAAKMGDRYISALEKFEPVVAKNVTYNVLERHIKPIFG